MLFGAKRKYLNLNLDFYKVFCFCVLLCTLETPVNLAAPTTEGIAEEDAIPVSRPPVTETEDVPLNHGEQPTPQNEDDVGFGEQAGIDVERKIDNDYDAVGSEMLDDYHPLRDQSQIYENQDNLPNNGARVSAYPLNQALPESGGPQANYHGTPADQPPIYDDTVPQYDHVGNYDMYPTKSVVYPEQDNHGVDPYTYTLDGQRNRDEQLYPLAFTPLGRAPPVGPVRKDDILRKKFGDYFTSFDDEIAFELPKDLHKNCWLQSMLATRWGFGPSCNKDGTYSSKQCHQKRCWCTDQQGKKSKKTGGLHDDAFYFGLPALTLECTQN